MGGPPASIAPVVALLDSLGNTLVGEVGVRRSAFGDVKVDPGLAVAGPRRLGLAGVGMVPWVFGAGGPFATLTETIALPTTMVVRFASARSG